MAEPGGGAAAALPSGTRRLRAAARGLTTRGRCLLAGGVAAGACAVVLDERDLLRIGLLACALPVVAVLVTAVRPIRVSAQHQVGPGRLQPGTSGQVLLTVANLGSARSPVADMTQQPVPGLTPGLRYLLPAIPRGGRTSVAYPIAATRRGRFVLGPPTVRVHDPFDLWEDSREVPARTEVLVVPSVIGLTGMPSSSGARSAASGRARIGTTGGDPDVGIRPYRSGDDIRTVHWRASARHDELVVRLEEPVSHGGATVLLDHRETAHRGEDADSSLETAVVLAASIALHLLDSDHRVRLISHRGAVIAEGHDIADDVLAGLAQLEVDGHAALTPVNAGRAGLVVAIVGEMTAADALMLAAARPRGADGVALVLDTPAWDRPAPARGRADGQRGPAVHAGGAGRVADEPSAPSAPSGDPTAPPTAARVLGSAGLADRHRPAG